MVDPVQVEGVRRREELKRVYEQASGCTRCPQLAATRQNVVFGAGDANADLMFVGEAPGASEDREGLPFVGQAGRLLSTLLGEIGLERGDVFIANVLKCRPPGNRDPAPIEIENCQPYLRAQVQLIQPRVIATLGNFATKLLRGDSTGITRLHGRPEVRILGGRAVRLYPLYHPAAALYTPAMLEILRADFHRLPQLLALPEPPQPPAADVERPTRQDRGAPAQAARVPDASVQRSAAQLDGTPTAGGSVGVDDEALAKPAGPTAPPTDGQLGLF